MEIAKGLVNSSYMQYEAEFVRASIILLLGQLLLLDLGRVACGDAMQFAR